VFRVQKRRAKKGVRRIGSDFPRLTCRVGNLGRFLTLMWRTYSFLQTYRGSVCLVRSLGDNPLEI
jgi:hypothetical protein